MKYVLLAAAAAAVSLLLGVLIERLIRGRKRWKMLTRALLSVVVSLMILCVTGFAYLSKYYEADETAMAALNGNETVQVTKENGVWYFDGPGREKALIFYPGAKVASEAYAPLLSLIAAKGEDCYLLDVPMHIALLDVNGAGRVIRKESHAHWYVGGHSMGGMTSALFAAGHPEMIDGVVLFAAYPTKALDAEDKMLSIYGSLDGVLDRTAYEENKKNWSGIASECVIQGGNHAGFGNYGVQSGDKEAEIDASLQQEAAAEAVYQFMEQ